MSADAELHTPEAHDVIACELTACVLGQRYRPELRVDLVGILTRLGQGMARAVNDFFSRLTPAQQRMLEAAAAADERERARGAS